MHPPILAYADYCLPFKVHTDASNAGLGAVLYQHQDGRDRVVAYASRSLKASEKNYPAHKLEFLALKWAIREKFHDYLYGAKFEVVSDNNPLTYVLTTAKLDATGQRWLAELANYNCSISDRSGKQNADADGLSRRKSGTETTIFPDVLKAICKAATSDQMLLTAIPTDQHHTLSLQTDQEVPVEALEGTALTNQDWQKAQTLDPDIKFIITSLTEGHRPAKRSGDRKLDSRYLLAWDNFKLKDGILYKSTLMNGGKVDQLVLPTSLRDIVFKAYHDDLGHQGRDRTTSLIRRRFFWPGMNQDIKKKVQQCERCIRRKTAPIKATGLVNITSTTPMELVCIDFLSLERSKGGYENILVITDHFSRYAQAIPTRNQTAQTTAKVLFENFFVHYGFPAVLHSDKGANFESKVIRKLCSIAGVKKSRTTPYHPMENGMVERYNKTLLNMLGTLSEQQKSDWKSYVSTLTHAYNAADHESTGYAPFYLMFGRHPRLAIDAFLGLEQDPSSSKSHQDYADKLREKLDVAYERASDEARRAAQKHKKYYDQNVKHIKLQPGDRILIRIVGLRGKQKLADIWDKHPYIIKGQPVPDVPVYEVQQENSKSKSKLLHKNMLLPFSGLPIPPEAKPAQKPLSRAVSISEDEYLADTSSDSSDEQHTGQNQPSKYIIPERRGQKVNAKQRKSSSSNKATSDDSSSPSTPTLRRVSRRRQPPKWMTSNECNISHIL